MRDFILSNWNTRISQISFKPFHIQHGKQKALLSRHGCFEKYYSYDIFYAMKKDTGKSDRMFFAIQHLSQR